MTVRNWLDRIRQRNPGQPLWRIAWWAWVCRPVALALLLIYRCRWWGVHRIPTDGPVLLICNHQSHLDLPLVGVGLWRRHFHPMAKLDLFNNPAFGWLIRSLNAFPVDTSKSDVKSVRTAIELLRQGQLVLIFPEGARTPTGRIQPFQEGMMLLIRRAKPTIVPAAIDGTWDIMPPGAARPKLTGHCGALYGEPIPAERLLGMTADEAMGYLRRTVEDLRLELRGRLRRGSNGCYPVPGPGDERVEKAVTESATPASNPRA